MDIIVIDNRLAQDMVGFGPERPETIVVNEHIPMLKMLDKIKTKVNNSISNQIGMLIIAAHGYSYRGIDGKAYSGFGMQLCQEDLDLKSVHLFSMLKGLFSSKDLGIRLMGCGVAADSKVKTEAGIQLGFGSRLCRALAEKTGTGVVASSDLQITSFGDVNRRNTRGLSEIIPVANPGCWEGQVWKFSPDGKRKQASVTDRGERPNCSAE